MQSQVVETQPRLIICCVQNKFVFFQCLCQVRIVNVSVDAPPPEHAIAPALLHVEDHVTAQRRHHPRLPHVIAQSRHRPRLQRAIAQSRHALQRNRLLRTLPVDRAVARIAKDHHRRLHGPQVDQAPTAQRALLRLHLLLRPLLVHPHQVQVHAAVPFASHQPQVDRVAIAQRAPLLRLPRAPRQPLAQPRLLAQPQPFLGQPPPHLQPHAAEDRRLHHLHRQAPQAAAAAESTNAATVEGAILVVASATRSNATSL